MKALSTLILLIVAFSAWAGIPKEPNTAVRSSKDVTYHCAKYTSNKIDPATRTSTDNPIRVAKSVVIETKEGYIINKGEAFSKQVVLVNDQMGSLSGMAGNPNTLLLRKENSYGGVYFITYLFEDSPGKDLLGKDIPGPNTGLVTLGECAVVK